MSTIDQGGMQHMEMGASPGRKKQPLKPKQLMQRFNFLKGQRSTWENHWQELAQYVLPNRNDINQRVTAGTKRNLTLLDNTAMVANELLAGALHGMLTNPNMQWFEFTTGDPAIDDLDPVRKWLQGTALRVNHLLNSSNFQTEIHQYYLDLTCMGTACMSVEEDEEHVVRFNTRHINEVFVAEDNKGRINEVYRRFRWNVRQIVAEWGKEVLAKSQSLQNAWQKNADQNFYIIHGVYPRDPAESNPDDPRRYVSQYVLESDEMPELSIGHFRERPYVVSRWTKASGETYGRSPSMNGLPDAKTLNKMTETTMRGAQKTVDPPLQLPDDGFVLPIDSRPAGLNFYRAGSPGTDRIAPIFNDARIDFGFQAMNDRRQRIREAFFVDQLQLGTGPQMTATEVMQRTEERMRLLGPMLGRQQSEFAGPLISRVLDIATRRDMIAELPEVLVAMGLETIDVVYSSLIARSQKVSETQSIMRTLEMISPFLEIDPSVADNFDGDSAVRHIAKTLGFPQVILRDEDKRDEIRQERMEQMQAQQEAEQEHQALQTAAKVAPAALAAERGGSGERQR